MEDKVTIKKSGANGSQQKLKIKIKLKEKRSADIKLKKLGGEGETPKVKINREPLTRTKQTGQSLGSVYNRDFKPLQEENTWADESEKKIHQSEGKITDNPIEDELISKKESDASKEIDQPVGGGGVEEGQGMPDLGQEQQSNLGLAGSEPGEKPPVESEEIFSGESNGIGVGGESPIGSDETDNGNEAGIREGLTSSEIGVDSGGGAEMYNDISEDNKATTGVTEGGMNQKQEVDPNGEEADFAGGRGQQLEQTGGALESTENQEQTDAKNEKKTGMESKAEIDESEQEDVAAQLIKERQRAKLNKTKVEKEESRNGLKQKINDLVGDFKNGPDSREFLKKMILNFIPSWGMTYFIIAPHGIAKHLFKIDKFFGVKLCEFGEEWFPPGVNGGVLQKILKVLEIMGCGFIFLLLILVMILFILMLASVVYVMSNPLEFIKEVYVGSLVDIWNMLN